MLFLQSAACNFLFISHLLRYDLEGIQIFLGTPGLKGITCS